MESKRFTIDDLLSKDDRSDNFVIEQDKKTGRPRVIRKRKDIPSKVCDCGKNQVCIRCFVENESENDVEKDIIEYLEKLPHCKVTKTGTKGRKIGRQRVKAKK